MPYRIVNKFIINFNKGTDPTKDLKLQIDIKLDPEIEGKKTGRFFLDYNLSH